MALTPATSDAFMREVDEGLRRDRLATFVRRYGRWLAILIGGGLILFGAYLYWQHHNAQVAGEEGERLTQALDKLARDQIPAARPDLTALASSSRDGYRAAAGLALASSALAANDVKTAAADFGKVANDGRLAQPYRDAALIRQTALEFDTLAPDAAIARLKGLAVPGSAWFGSAGELTAIAHLKAGRPRDAATLFARIGTDPTVPRTIRSRAVQMAAILGVEIPDQLQVSAAK